MADDINSSVSSNTTTDIKPSHKYRNETFSPKYNNFQPKSTLSFESPKSSITNNEQIITLQSPKTISEQKKMLEKLDNQINEKQIVLNKLENIIRQKENEIKEQRETIQQELQEIEKRYVKSVTYNSFRIFLDFIFKNKKTKKTYVICIDCLCIDLKNLLTNFVKKNKN